MCTINNYFPPLFQPKVVNIDPGRANVVGDCKSPVRSFMMYPNTEEVKENDWWLQLIFNETSQIYNLTVIGAGWVDSGGGSEYKAWITLQ